LAYRTWGKEQFVNDELIKADLRKMSHGQIDVADEASIDSYKNINASTPGNIQRPKKHKGQGGGQQHRRFQSNRQQGSGNKHKKRY
jgi:hypothetical protein